MQTKCLKTTTNLIKFTQGINEIEGISIMKWALMEQRPYMIVCALASMQLSKDWTTGALTRGRCVFISLLKVPKKVLGKPRGNIVRKERKSFCCTRVKQWSATNEQYLPNELNFNSSSTPSPGLHHLIACDSGIHSF